MARIKTFNPSDIGIKNDNIFGLPFTREQARLVILPVPWEVTVSYRAGAALGPEAILDESLQVDLFDPDIKNAWRGGIFMEPISGKWRARSAALRKKTAICIKHLERGGDSDALKIKKLRGEINHGGANLNKWVKDQSGKILDERKIPAVLGGDHATPLGLIQALAGRYNNFGILHIDAHADLRDAYEGFEFSHASVMFNALKMKQINKLVQVAVRDYCEEEAALIKKSKGRVKLFTDREIKRALFKGSTWEKICADIIKNLPQSVYVSFDIDGLDPKLCPNTGTPVPGGLEFEQVFFLLEKLVKTGRKIIGFDLCEVGPEEIDVITGARVLYRLANLAIKSAS